MTTLKTVLISATAALALSTPALAGGHGEDGHMKKAEKHSTKMMSQKAKTDTHTMKSKMKDKNWSSDTNMMEKSEVRGKVLETGESYDDYVGEVLQSNETNVRRMEGDDKLLMSKGEAKREATVEMQENDKTIRNNAIVVPTTNGQYTTTVSCPVGTTAQPDMTCLVTGDYDPAD